MNQTKYLLFLILCAAYGNSVTAQFDNLIVERASTNYELPNGYITQMIEDDFGFLWIGTREGLFRYDGYECKAFRHDVQDSTSLSNTGVSTLCEDGDEGIWAGTAYGLNLLDRRTGTFKKFLPYPEQGRKSKAGNNVREIFKDRQDNLWILCRWNIIRFDRKSEQFTLINQQGDPEARHFARCFFEDSEGVLWAGASTGLLRFRAGDPDFRFILPDSNIQSEYNQNITGIIEGPDGAYWLGTNGGLVKWNEDDKILETDRLPAALRGIPVNDLFKDSKGNIWIALEKNGLVAYHTDQRQFYHFRYEKNHFNTLSSNEINHIFEDAFQNIWLSTENGVNKIRLFDSGFHLIQNEKGNGNRSNSVIRVLQDKKGDIWTKTPEGIFHLKKGRSQAKAIPELDPSREDVNRGWFLEDPEGGICVAVGGDGIYRSGPEETHFKRMPLSESLSKGGINKMLNDQGNEEVIWIGSTEGLCRLNRKTLEEQWYFPRDDEPEVVSDQVVVFEQFGNDEIWLYFTYSNCIGSFNKRTGKFKRYLPPPDKQFVLEGIVREIAISRDGNIWFATSNGLTNFNIHTKEFALYGKREGLPESVLQTVLIDDQDRVWVSGNLFVARFDPATQTFYPYPVSREIRYFHSKSGYVSQGGSILLGSMDGIYTFHPDRINKNQIVPEVVLTDFRVKNESYLLDSAYEKTTNIVLSHDENDIAFAFSGIHYVDPEANQYRCKLSNFDEEWRALGNEHKVSYTNLNPGEYTFRATASNSDDRWNEKGLVVHLTITPAYWQTVWFKTLILLVITSIGYALFKNRQHQLALRRQKEIAEQSAAYKTRFLADVSHEIRTPMNAIIGLSKLTLDTKLDPKQSKFISAIRQSSQNLLTIINDLLDHSKLEAGKFTFVRKPFNLYEIAEQLNDTLGHKAEEKGLAFESNIAPSIPRELIGDPLRLNQILTNLLGNALKFTQEGKVWLSVDQLQGSDTELKLRFTVGDTGVGIAQDQLAHIFESYNQVENDKVYAAEGTGLGLSIARQLVERQGGQLFIESEVNKGTKLWFDLVFGVSEGNEQVPEPAGEQFVLFGLCILVVEDNYFNQMLMVEILEKHIRDAKIEIAENGKVALEKLDQQLYDLVIMDVKMPVMDGYEATGKIRRSESPVLQKIPVLAVTASAIPEQLQQCREAGMDDYVTKPVDEVALLEKIAALTKSRSPRIDRSKLKALLASDEKKVSKFLDIFKTQTPEQLVQLKKHLAERNWEQVSLVAHTLKSQCRYVGLGELAALAHEIEQGAEEGKAPDMIGGWVIRLEEELRGVIENEL